MLEEALNQIGLSNNESKIYLELFKIGPQAVSVIAKRVALNRSTTYSILRALEKKGLVASYKNAAVKFFLANDPNCLISYVDGKCSTYDYYRTQLITYIPKFRALNADYCYKKPIVSYFDGTEGVKQVLFDLLRYEGEALSFISFDKWFRCPLNSFFDEFLKTIFVNNSLKVKIVTPETEEVREFLKDFKNQKICEEILFVDDGEKTTMFENEMIIYNGKVVIIHLVAGEEYAVIIESKEMFAMQKSIFNVVWKSFKQSFAKVRRG